MKRVLLDTGIILQAIITRDKSGFVDSPIPVFTPVEMISQLVSQSI